MLGGADACCCWEVHKDGEGLGCRDQRSLSGAGHTQGAALPHTETSAITGQQPIRKGCITLPPLVEHEGLHVKACIRNEPAHRRLVERASPLQITHHGSHFRMQEWMRIPPCECGRATGRLRRGRQRCRHNEGPSSKTSSRPSAASPCTTTWKLSCRSLDGPVRAKASWGCPVKEGSCGRRWAAARMRV